MSFFLFMSAISAVFGQGFNLLANDPFLLWNYGSAAILSFFGGIAFWFTFRELDSMEDQLNEIPTGHVGSNKQVGDAEK
jgi:proton-dependent oligopeptide transporter, POT family